MDIYIAGYYGDILGKQTKALKSHEICKYTSHFIFYHKKPGPYTSLQWILNVLPDMNTESDNDYKNILSNIFLYLLKHKSIDNLLDYITNFNIIKYDLTKLKSHTNYKKTMI